MDGNQQFHSTAATIRAMAEQHGVSYTETKTDIWTQQITRLADDEVVYGGPGS
jgi:hypothetical protein